MSGGVLAPGVHLFSKPFTPERPADRPRAVAIWYLPGVAMSLTRTHAPDFVVLIGPPGSGKTHLGHALAGAFDVEFVEGERLLLEKYGSTENFIRHKDEALRGYHQYLTERQAAKGGVMAFESTGLSDRVHLLALIAARDCALVRVDADRTTCVARVAQRASGRNFESVDPSQFHDFWCARVGPQYAFELRVHNDGNATAQALEQLALALHLPRGVYLAAT